MGVKFDGSLQNLHSTNTRHVLGRELEGGEICTVGRRTRNL